ncbi:MAG: RimK family alpha-L-glutamate ligase [Chitinophagales bacterium]|nr:RimK family alpha-L-glutamate ligase [Chitinophagales bacterium]
MNIVVLSRSNALYSTQSIVAAARERNHSVRVIDHLYCDLIIESGKSKILYHNQPVNDVDAVIPRIGASVTNHGVMILRQLESQGIFTTLKAEPLLMARDKLSCLQILSSHNIQVPKTIYISNPYTIPHLLDELGSYPVIIKLASGTQGMGVILAESKGNTESILEAFYTTKEKVLLQKFVKEAKGTDIRAFVVDGKVVAAMKRIAKSGDFRSNMHRGGSMERIRLTSEQEEVAIRSAKILGLHVAGVDMLPTSSGPVVLEVNVSPGLEGIETTTGIDIAATIIKFIERNHK